MNQSSSSLTAVSSSDSSIASINFRIWGLFLTGGGGRKNTTELLVTKLNISSIFSLIMQLMDKNMDRTM